ncbi:MAG: hypothetical protein ACLPY5_03570 [Candidatus Bathyarchaeia archaeon]
MRTFVRLAPGTSQLHFSYEQIEITGYGLGDNVLILIQIRFVSLYGTIARSQLPKVEDSLLSEVPECQTHRRSEYV